MQLSKKNMKILMIGIVFLIILALGVSGFFIFFNKSNQTSNDIETIQMNGQSMEPKLKNGDLFKCQKILSNTIIRRNELVAFVQSDRKIVKRVIAIPGDVIKIVDSQVYLNDKLLEENYLFEQKSTMDGDGILAKGKSIQIKENEYFVMGDNRGVSFDSRYSGPVKRDQLYCLVVN